MRKLFLYLLAAFMLSSCDNLKKKDSKSDTDDEEVTKKKKKPLDDEDVSDEETPKKKKPTVDDDDMTTTDDNDTKKKNSDYATGWTTAEKQQFLDNCAPAAMNNGLSERQANAYCSCMQEKLEKLYPVAEESAKMSNSKMNELAKECAQ